MALACQFSEQFSHNLQLICSSNNSQFVASSLGSRVTVRNFATSEVIHIFSCVDKIEKIEFSPNSEYLLCGLYERCAVQVFCIADNTWKCRINEGIAGMVHCRWAPDSKHIITESDFGIQLAVWSLIDGSSGLIAYPKPTNIIAFSDDGNYCAIGLRIELVDYIGVYSINNANTVKNQNESVSNWNEVSKFKSRSQDIQSIYFLPNSHLIITVDTCIQYHINVYLLTGEVYNSNMCEVYIYCVIVYE